MEQILCSFKASAPVEVSPQPGPSRVREDPEKTEELVVVCIEEFEHEDIPTQSF